MNGTARRTLVVVDFDNTRLSVGVLPPPAMARWLMDQIRALGDVAFALVFVDAGLLSRDMRLALAMNGFWIIDCPKVVKGRSGITKDTVDGILIESMHRVLQQCPDITSVAIFSGDRDFVPALATWRNAGKEILVYAGDGLSPEIKAIANLVVRYGPTGQTPAAALIKPRVYRFTTALTGRANPAVFDLMVGSTAEVRDAVATFFRDTVLPVAHDGQGDLLTAQFYLHGLKEQLGSTDESSAAAATLFDALCRGVVASVSNHGREPYYFPVAEHPFIEYVLSLPVPASADND